MSVDEAKKEFASLFNYAKITSWDLTLVNDGVPIEAYRIFKTKDAAETYVEGDEDYIYSYPGATISVVGDTVPENNGLYLAMPKNADTSALFMSKIYDASTVDKNIQEAISSSRAGVNLTYIRYPEAEPPVQDSSMIYLLGTTLTDSSEGVRDLYFMQGAALSWDGALLNSSDIRLKDVTEKLSISPEEISKIDKIKFLWKSRETDNVQIGVSAQSVENVFPELVTVNPDTGYKMVNYQGLSVIALSAIDSLNSKIESLEDRVKQLEHLQN